jgi:hypothetical protein
MGAGEMAGVQSRGPVPWTEARVNADSERWKEIARSEFPWEQEARAFIRERAAVPALGRAGGRRTTRAGERR